MTPTLTIEGPAGTLRTLPVRGPVSIGRSPESTVVVDDPEVSWQHCVLWVEHGVVWIRDLESRNGTTVAGERVTRATPVADGARIEVGSFVAVLRCGEGLAPRAAWSVMDVATGLRYALRDGRFRIGPSADADLQLEGIEPQLLSVHDGEVFLGDEAIDPSVEHTVGPLRFRVVPADARQEPTVDSGDALYAYEIEVDLNGATGPVATVRSPRDGLAHRIEATNRAILLYVLVKRWEADHGERVPRDRRGWCDDDDLIIGVWGKAALADGAGKLKALLHRIRQELKDAGFDPWFVEKKRGYTRVRVARVMV